MSRRRWLRISFALSLASICVASACSSTPGGPEPLETLAYGAPLAPADPQPESPASTATGAGICPGGAPVICDQGCCQSGTGCDDAGIGADAGYDAGCIAPGQPPSCPAAAPLLCSAQVSCDGGGCVAIDSSGNGNSGALGASASFGEGRFGAGLTQGTPSIHSNCQTAMEASFANLPDNDQPITVELWFKLGPQDGGQSVELFRDENGSRSLVVTSTTAYWGNDCSLPVPLGDGQWHFAGTSWDPASDAGALLLIDDATHAASCARFGGASGGGSIVLGYCLDGSIDEVRVLDFALDGGTLAADADAGPFTADPHTLGLWHFDEANAYRCCEPGSGCDPSGNCSDAGPSAPTCPSDTPMDCGFGCCPAGASCGNFECVNPPAQQGSCTADMPLLCDGGFCCPSTFQCGATTCVLDPGTPPPGDACPSGYALTPSGPVAGDSDFCCPTGSVSSASEVYEGSNLCVLGGCANSSTCPSGFTCQSFEMEGSAPNSDPAREGNPDVLVLLCAAAPIAPACSPVCAGGCCNADAGETCATGTGCCPAATPACGEGCCSPSDCDAGICTTANSAPSCPNGEPLCGANCCGGGTFCSAGFCVSDTNTGHICIGGTVCGDTCCGPTWSCVAPGVCAQPPIAPDCTPQFPNACGIGGPCCAPGCVCMGSAGAHQQAIYCVCDKKARGGPQGPRCPDGNFCDVGQACVAGGCCAADHPQSCGSSCCLPGAPCTDGQCGCPSDTLSCGNFCCGEGADCVNGACEPRCPTDLPDPCGDGCCAPGVTAIPDGGTSPFSCPGGGVPCGVDCCEPGGACNGGACSCPPDRPTCGSACCDPSQVCVGGSCQSPSSGEGDSNCYSTGICLPSVLSNSCECGGSASETQCVSGHPACSTAGGACNDNVHACCVGETCINSSCVNGCGQCTGIGCNP